MTVRSFVGSLSIATALVAGCADALGPPVFGSWGGAGLLVTSAPSALLFRFACSQAHFSHPLAPDSGGSFTLEGVAVASYGNIPVTIQGKQHGDTLDIEVGFSGQPLDDHFAVHRDRTADYSGIACLETVR